MNKFGTLHTNEKGTNEILRRNKTMAKRRAIPKSLFREIEAKKKKLAKLRDEFQNMLSHAEDVLASISEANDNVEDALRLLRNAETEMSRYV